MPLGVAESVTAFEAAGFAVADWVHQMLARGCPTFYQRDAQGVVQSCYQPQAGAYVPLPRDPRALRAAGLPLLQRNDSAGIRDMGDGVALWQFHSKQNSIDDALIDSGHAALELITEGRCRALIIGNDGPRFSIGYNLALALQRIEAGEFDALERSVQRLAAADPGAAPGACPGRRGGGGHGPRRRHGIAAGC